MFRRSSKRAFSSTTQTLCLPFSAASISAGRERRVVARPVHGRLERRRPIRRGSGLDERLDARRERVVGVLHDDVARRDLSEQVVVLGADQAALRVRDPRLVLQVGPVELVELAHVGEVEQAVDRVDAVRLDAEAARRAAPASRARSSSTPRAGRPRRSAASAARSRPPRAGRRRRPRSRCRRRA